ncbi:MAG: hypothetical protein HY690_16715 [Chloroflexi bacterium]|nr:hypothetical protein [Chloroflexota bacterium]
MLRPLAAALPWALLAVASWVHTAGLALGQVDTLLGIVGLIGLGLAGAQLRVASSRRGVAVAPGPLALAAHEIRSPLTAIRGYAELLQRQPPTLDADQRQACLTSIVYLCDRLANLSRALLDAEQAAEGRLALARAPFDLAEVARRAVEVARASHAGQTFLVEAEPHLLPALGDAERVEDVLANLLANAARFAPANTEVRLELAASAPDGVCVRVVDRGPDLAEDARARLFEPFSPGAPGAAQAGYGLGLYIARRYLEGMGGRIWAEATPGGGRAFCFMLPWAAAQAAGWPAAVPAAR